jgi:hypothetical protein
MKFKQVQVSRIDLTSAEGNKHEKYAAGESECGM